MPFAARKLLDIEAGLLVLRVPEDDHPNFQDVIQIVANKLRESKTCPSFLERSRISWRLRRPSVIDG